MPTTLGMLAQSLQKALKTQVSRRCGGRAAVCHIARVECCVLLDLYMFAYIFKNIYLYTHILFIFFLKKKKEKKVVSFIVISVCCAVFLAPCIAESIS